MRHHPCLLAVLLGLNTAGCADAASENDAARLAALPYAREVVRFDPGPGAGFGQDQLPDIALGPPRGALDVVSLGRGGTIVLGFGDRVITDEPGPDFVVFENPFLTDFVEDGVWEELAEVSVSVDGQTWTTFPCDPAPTTAGRWPGCAGWTPLLAYDPLVVDPIDPARTGGDPFDLAEIGLSRARFVRLRDLSGDANDEQAAGFDLDAVGLVNHAEATDEAR